jgi:glucuronate isomerase
MVADSRSFLSFTRHEYFRRILCNLLGAEMATGLLPRDFDLVGALVEDVCFRNAASFFRFEQPDRLGEAGSASASPLHAPALG